MAIEHPWMQPSRDPDLEPVRAARGVGRDWFRAYNDEDPDEIRELVRFPAVSFGGGRLDRENLAFYVLEDPETFEPTYRDPMWNHSITDTWAVHQFSADKAHYVANFRRLLADGSSYGMALSRLAIVTKEDGGWATRVLSSGSLRNPQSVEERTDADSIKRAKAAVIDLFETYNEGDDGALRDRLHYPNVLLDGPELTVADSPDDTSIDRLERGDCEILSMEVLPPQSGDKVLVDVNAQYRREDGGQDVYGAMYLVTKQDDSWGVQLRSPRRSGAPIP